MRTLLSRAFWDYAGERAVKTIAQTAVALIGTALIWSGVDWQTVMSGAALAGVVSILTSLGSDWKTPAPVDKPVDNSDEEAEEVV